MSTGGQVASSFAIGKSKVTQKFKGHISVATTKLELNAAAILKKLVDKAKKSVLIFRWMTLSTGVTVRLF